MLPTRRQVLSAALLLPVLLSVVWSNLALWRCQYDGLARSECCCPKPAGDGDDDSAGQAPAAATIAPAECCDIEQYLVDRAPAEAARASAAQLAAAVTAALAVVPSGLLEHLAPTASDPAPVRPPDDGPPRGRSILSQKQALLI
jgi:hypothetical protein